MKTLIIGALLASSALSGVAQAQNTGPYITFEGGAVRNERADLRSGNGYEHSDRFKTGWEAGGALGYDFGHFRAEVEAFYHESKLKSASRPLGTPLPNGTFDQSNGLSGNTNSRAVMANGLFGLGHWGGLKAYAGGGVGYARTFVSDGLQGAGLIEGHSQGLAWQALAGVTVPISRTIDLGVKYRYFRPDGAEDFNYSGGGTRHASLRSHSLLATLTFNFGRPAAEPMQEAAPPPPPPPPPPSPPPPPPLVQAVCNTGPFILFFDWNRSDISGEAASILDSAIQAYGSCGSMRIMLAGYTDSSGTARYNLGLAERRDQAVQSYLNGHGIGTGVISAHAFGEANQRVATADGVRELQNRRVEITYGPGAGY
ncbi:OmpA family protein [Novosphingobium sp. KACC 22771]|uniref:OmpA family protein n=1 Tax=Novosphingobium sp. KACC 22771 TaxID=3025670 RepID=UPI002366F09F|nr:OmpA family protein [Novosphingobium sp. KACC 22771]WDF72506.1 OmpA family protein [Novosphingobium sp. KACC 22771]